jgi:hypothetical protein
MQKTNLEDQMTDEQVQKLGAKLDEMDTHSNKELLELDGEPNNQDIPDQEVYTQPVPGISDKEEFTEEDMREMGLSEDTIEDLKDVTVYKDDVPEVKLTKEDYVEAASNYMDLSNNDAMQLLDILVEYKRDPEGKYYDRLPKKVQDFADGIRLSSTSANMKMTKNSAARFVLSNITRDAEFGKVVDDYSNEMSGIMNDMHGEFQAIVQESFDDLFSNIEKIKDDNPEQAEVLQKFYDAFKNATTFELQLKWLDGGVTKKKINKWLTRYDNECFYFNRKVNSDVNKERGIKFSDIQTLVPTIKRARDGFTEIQIKQFIIVFLKSIEKMDLTDLTNLFYIYGVISAIDSFKYNNTFDSELGETLFGNITKVIQKIISLE